jgi:putative thioredoxin
MPQHAISEQTADVTNERFPSEVIEASRSVPVIVDFWAPWCGPCRVLKPILEKLASEYNGRFKLVKVNVDENQEVAATYGVRSIPDVMAFRDGQPVSHFLGAVPESQVRAFIESVLPNASETERARALALREAGDLEGAMKALCKALELDSANVAARLDLAELLIEQGRPDEAETVLAKVPSNIDWDERVATLRSAIAFARASGSGDGEAALKDKLAKDPADNEARFALASRYAGSKRYREALDELLEIVRRDKQWKNGEARKQTLAIFNLAEGQPELVSEYRRKLASTLH